MTHCYTDFLLLCALGTARKNEALADALTNTDALLCGCLTEDTLIHGLTVLQNEGYISLPGGEADADTVCLLTAKGRQAIAVPVLSRLFGRRDAALFAREDAFLAAPAGNGETTVVLRPGAFDTVHSRLLRAAGANGDYDGAPWITVARCEGGMAVTLRVPGEEGPDESDDSAADSSSVGDSSSGSDSNGGGSYDGAAPEDALAMSDSVRAVYPDGLVCRAFHGSSAGSAGLFLRQAAGAQGGIACRHRPVRRFADPRGCRSGQSLRRTDTLQQAAVPWRAGRRTGLRPVRR